jgi:hypothetical protein
LSDKCERVAFPALPGRRRMLAALLPLCTMAAFPRLAAFGAPQSADSPPVNATANSLTVEQIVRQLEERNRQRAAALRKFEGKRIYSMHYQGFFGTREAEMVVGVKSSADEREFTVESQSGSKFIVDRIFKKLLEGEKEAASDEYRRRTALSSQNYDFALAGQESNDMGSAYVLNVIPKTDEKYLYRGKIWVDAQDFAVARIEAEPAKSPSIWVKKTEIKHKYEKIEEFWLPAENRTDSAIRFGGHALLSIEYEDYKIIEANGFAQAMAGAVATSARS